MDFFRILSLMGSNFIIITVVLVKWYWTDHTGFTLVPTSDDNFASFKSRLAYVIK